MPASSFRVRQQPVRDRGEGRLRHFGATLSAFQITLPSSYTDLATNTLVTNGQQRNQGLEFVVFGEPLDGLKLNGGLTVLNASMTNTQGGLNNGNQAVGTTPFQASLTARLGYAVPARASGCWAASSTTARST